MLKLKFYTFLFLYVWFVQGLLAQESFCKESTLPVNAKGDVNGDRIVDVRDIVYLVNATMGHPIDGYDEKVADINGDGVVDEADIAEISNIIMGRASE